MQTREENRKAVEKYKKTEKGKRTAERRRIAVKKYYNTPEGRAKQAVYRKKYIADGRAKIAQRKCRLKIQYNITIEQYDKLSFSQNNVCAICGLPETAKNQFGIMRLAIDHDHKTGKIRGLLCGRCNLVTGFIEKAPGLALNIRKYLQKWKK